MISPARKEVFNSLAILSLCMQQVDPSCNTTTNILYGYIKHISAFTSCLSNLSAAFPVRHGNRIIKLCWPMPGTNTGRCLECVVVELKGRPTNRPTCISYVYLKFIHYV